MPCDDEGEAGGDETEGGGPVGPDVSLSLDATFAVLADSERRLILRTLTQSSDHTATVEALVTRLVEREADERGELPSPDSVALRIHHIHLPKLVDVGLADYDARNEEIRYWPDDRLETWLQRAREGDSG